MQLWATVGAAGALTTCFACAPTGCFVLVSVQLVVCDSPAGRLGLTVCYDLRFPEVYQALTWAMGAKVLLVPSAFTKVTGRFLLHHDDQVLPLFVTS